MARNEEPLRNRKRGETKWGGKEGKVERVKEVGESEKWGPRGPFAEKSVCSVASSRGP